MRGMRYLIFLVILQVERIAGNYVHGGVVIFTIMETTYFYCYFVLVQRRSDYL